jgi:predicted dehydrogenase
MGKFNVALIGTGSVAREHIQGWALAGSAVIATAGPEPPSADVRYVIPNVPHFPDISAALHTSPDIVDLCTPQHLHLVQLWELRDWRGPVLIEKPLITRATELELLRVLLKDRQYPLLMRTNKRFENHIIKLFETASRFSRPLHLRVAWRQRPEYMAERQWYRRRTTAGGGVVLGMGIHYFDVLAPFLQDAVIESVVKRTYRCPPNAPDTTSENYARILISSSQIKLDLTLSCWKPGDLLPDERLLITDATQRVSIRRQDTRDVEGELSREFEHYTSVITDNRFHPEKAVMLRSHEMALRIYEVADQCAGPRSGQ